MLVILAFVASLVYANEEGDQKIEVNMLPGHGVIMQNEPIYDPFTLGAQHGFNPRVANKRLDIDTQAITKLQRTAADGNKDSFS